MCFLYVNYHLCIAILKGRGIIMSTILLVDSCSDLPLSYIQENNDIIDTIGMPVSLEGREFIDDLGKTYSHKEFFDKLREGIMPSTALINVYRFAQKFKEHCKNGDNIIYLGFSSALSGTFNNARLARNEVLEEYPDFYIEVIDTVSASIGLGIIIVQAVRMMREGKSKVEVIQWVEKNKLKSNHWFAVDDLNFLKNGGRVSSTSATIGTLLNVKPILTVDREGKLKSYSNVRGRKKALKFLVEKFKENSISSEKTTLIIGHGDCEDDAIKISEMVNNEVNLEAIILSQLSTTIASHVGPNMIAFAFIGKEREN